MLTGGKMGFESFLSPFQVGRLSLYLALLGTAGAPAAIAQSAALTLATGFSPNPTVLQGRGGGDRAAAEVVKVRQTPTGPCLGYISPNPHQTITLSNRFSNLEMRVTAEADTTLVIEGPGGVWCNDDSNGQNPQIAGEWLPGNYRVWIGSYRPGDVPDYSLSIRDRS